MLSHSKLHIFFNVLGFLSENLKYKKPFFATVLKPIPVIEKNSCFNRMCHSIPRKTRLSLHFWNFKKRRGKVEIPEFSGKNLVKHITNKIQEIKWRVVVTQICYGFLPSVLVLKCEIVGSKKTPFSNFIFESHFGKS